MVPAVRAGSGAGGDALCRAAVPILLAKLPSRRFSSSAYTADIWGKGQGAAGSARTETWLVTPPQGPAMSRGMTSSTDVLYSLKDCCTPNLGYPDFLKLPRSLPQGCKTRTDPTGTNAVLVLTP